MTNVFLILFLVLVVITALLIPALPKAKEESQEAADSKEDLDEELIFEKPESVGRFCVVHHFIADNATYTTIGVPYVIGRFNLESIPDVIEALFIAAESTYYFKYDEPCLSAAASKMYAELIHLRPDSSHVSFEFFGIEDTRYSFVVHITRVK